MICILEYKVYKCTVASIGFVAMCLARGFSIPQATSEEEQGNNIFVEEDSPATFTINNVGFLILSSTLGIIVGDVLWLEALRLLGPKQVIVIDSIKPFMAAILGRLALDEILLVPAWGGMVLTVLGVGVVAWEEQRVSSIESNNTSSSSIEKEERRVSQTNATARITFNNDTEGVIILPGTDECNRSDKVIDTMEQNISSSCVETKQQSSTENGEHKRPTSEQNHSKRGYTCAIVNVLADSLGSLLTKKYGVGMTTWSINLIRFGFAGVTLVCISIGMRFRQCCNLKSEDNGNIDTAIDAPAGCSNNEEPTTPLWFELPTLSRLGWLQITTGVGLVTFLCPALSNYALFQIALGLAISLGSIGPLYGLFFDWPFKGKRPTLYGCIGVLLAIAGVVILCVWGT